MPILICSHSLQRFRRRKFVVTLCDLGLFDSIMISDQIYLTGNLGSSLAKYHWPFRAPFPVAKMYYCTKYQTKIQKKWEYFSDEELRQQIIDVIKAIEEVEVDLETLVINALNEETSKTSVVTLDKIGIWKGSFNCQCIGTLVTDKKLRLFRKVKQSYYRVCDLTENPDEWEMLEVIPSKDYSYVECQGMILLKLRTQPNLLIFCLWHLY